MSVLKCKICGGDIELTRERTLGTCMYCGSTTTFPEITDEQRINAFNRGNYFRRLGKFDEALSVYNQIIEEDDTDAEAHWCAAISRFGIEYVEDPESLEYIPTCHRASFDSFLEDIDYLAAVKHSEGATQKQYIRDGKKIEEIQKAILTTSSKMAPFDVFICYKESDGNNQRTVDSVLAQEIYYALTEKGFKTFFARITLEDKAGSEYEPYIFAALNSAKVMVVVGTSSENLDSVWVKNEWSRFMALMKKDGNKVLIPCYKDVNPYDMPKALSVIQSYNMSSIGFMQDLIRGISKIVSPQSMVHISNNFLDVEACKKRIEVFLENGDFKNANSYCNKILDILPQDGETYVLKLCSELKVKSQSKLNEAKTVFDKNSSYLNAIKFCTEDDREKIESALKNVKERKQKARRKTFIAISAIVITALFFLAVGYYIKSAFIPEQKYKEAISLLDNEEYEEAKKILISLGEYKDSSVRAQECSKLRRDQEYNEIVNLIENGEYQKALSELSEYSDYLDYSEKIKDCYIGIIASSRVGDIVSLGEYPEGVKLDWIVIDKNADEAFLLCKHVITSDYYVNDDGTYGYERQPNWMTSNIRYYLNNTFWDKAFSENEKELIKKTTCDNSVSKSIGDYKVKSSAARLGGPDYYTYFSFIDTKKTEDYVFVVSYDEYLEYVHGKDWEEASIVNSAYSNSVAWWIRNGIYEKKYDDEGYKGDYYGCLLNTDCPLKDEELYPERMGGIRPAVKISLK